MKANFHIISIISRLFIMLNTMKIVVIPMNKKICQEIDPYGEKEINLYK